jgi:hypothetical protein
MNDLVEVPLQLKMDFSNVIGHSSCLWFNPLQYKIQDVYCDIYLNYFIADVWGKLCGLIHYNIKYEMFIVTYI